MKLELYQSSTTYQSAKFMLSKLDNSDILIDNIVVVPDKYSLLTEKMVLDLSEGGSVFNVRVKSLSSLSAELLQKLGLGRSEVISSGESLLLTQMAIENVKKDFIVFKKSNINFCYEINKLISQFKSSCVEGYDLNITAPGVVGHKYHDLALIYNEYQRLLSGKLDANERLKLLKNSLQQKNILSKTRIYFAHFEAFTKEAFDFAEVLFSQADCVGVSLAYPNSVGNEYIYEKDLLGKFEKLANKHGQQVDVFLSDNLLNPYQQAICKGLYSYEKVKTDNNGFYNIYGAGSITAEVESVAKLIRYYTYKGNRFRDFQIAVGNLPKYQQTIEEVFERYDIPFYIDSSITADKTILGNFVLEFLYTCSTGFGKDNLIDFFANILVKDDKSIQICRDYEVDGRSRYKQYIEKITPFAEEFSALENSSRAKDFSKAVNSLYEKVKDKYQDVLTALKDRDDLKEYKINLQGEEVLKNCMQLIDKYDLSEMDCGEYLKKLQLLLSFKQVSTVPTYLDSVMIGDATQSGFEEKPFMVILGGEELPVVAGDNGLLSDEELKINSVCKEIEPTIRMINRRNRFKLFNLLSLAQNRLFLFYQITNSEGKRNELPAYAKSLNGIFNQSPQNVKVVFFANNPEGEEWALLASGLKEKEVNFDYLSREVKLQGADKLLLENDRVKVTQLESYFVCPFKHFANYGLKLKEAFEQFDPRDLGTVCHKMAEIFVQQKIMTDEYEGCDIKEFVEKNIDWVLKSEGAKDKIEFLEEKASLIGFLKKQMISLLSDIVKERNKSKFKPRYVEVKFDNLKLGKYTLIGKADRIDEYKDYLRIVDYKTGKTGSLLKGLYYGEKLQLFLYQKVACEKYNKREGGVFYFNAKFNYSKGEDREAILKGIIDEDDDLIRAIDRDIEIGGRSEITEITKDDKGYKGGVISPYPLKKLSEYAFKVGQVAVDEIERGYIAPKPNADACEWCPFGALCGYELQSGVRSNKDQPQF